MKPILFTILLLNSLVYCQIDSLNTFNELETFDKRRWLTIGIEYENLNNLYGFNLSNGFDLQNVIHFEDFQDNLIFKFSFLTDLNDNYAFESNIGLLLRSKIFNRANLNYSKKRVKGEQFDFENISLRLKSRYFGNTYLLLDIGKQRINELNNYGFDIGIRRIIKGFHIGLLIGYYSGLL